LKAVPPVSAAFALLVVEVISWLTAVRKSARTWLGTIKSSAAMIAEIQKCFFALFLAVFSDLE
jgi:hypothetical protein